MAALKSLTKKELMAQYGSKVKLVESMLKAEMITKIEALPIEEPKKVNVPGGRKEW